MVNRHSTSSPVGRSYTISGEDVDGVVVLTTCRKIKKVIRPAQHEITDEDNEETKYDSTYRSPPIDS